jgi:hypothetical protein
MSADPHDGQKKRHLSSPETEARDYLAHCHVTPKSSACSSVGGAVPTSPPLRQKECPQDESSHRGCATCEGAGVIYVIDWQLEGAAPTSTPLKHGPDCPLSQMIGSINSEGEIEVSSWPESACSCVPTSTPLDALRERLQFVAPPGPPDPPPSHASVTHCPNGHRLLWTSNRQAICDAQGTALCVAWELTVGNDGRRRLTEVVNPTARSFAYSLQKLLAASPASALVAPRKEKET